MAVNLQAVLLSTVGLGTEGLSIVEACWLVPDDSMDR